MSVLLFEKILNDHEEIRKDFEVYLQASHIELIKHLINPKCFDDTHKPWDGLNMAGKEYIFAIVNNLNSGLDVDKLDYLIRDSSAGVLGMPKESVDRLLLSMKIVPCVDFERNNFYWIGFRADDYDTVKRVFDARIHMHRTLYNHKNILEANEM